MFLVGDCFDHMAALPSGSVDMILADLPYGTTQNKWDSMLDLPRLWAEYWRLCPKGAVVLTAQSPFDATLKLSEMRRFRYQWVWEKTAATGFLNAKRAPLKAHELCLVFAQRQPTYNPAMSQGHLIKRVNASYAVNSENYGKQVSIREPYASTSRYPRDVLLFPKDNRIGKPHPTQKPVALFEYLIRTYTNEGQTVLDNTAGSGTTAIAAIRSKRDWICIERDPEYAAKAQARIAAEMLS